MTGITETIAFIELAWIAMTLLKMLGNVGIKKQENARVKMLDWFTLLPEKTWTKKPVKTVIFCDGR